MAILARLRVLETLSRGRIESYRALDSANNATLLLHYGDALLFDIADDLGDDVLEWGDAGNKQYIVTRDAPEYEDLNKRPPASLEAKGTLGRAGRWPVTRIDPSNHGNDTMERVMSTDEPPESTEQPGEFTRFFKPVLRPSPPAKAAAPPPGEFTQMFKAPAAQPSDSSSTPIDSVTVPEPVAPRVVEKQPQRPERATKFRSPETKPEPGEFTRIFRPPSAPQPEAPSSPAAVPPPTPPQPAAKTGPGDFTRMFSAVPASEPVQNVPEPPKPSNEPGSFTAFFQKPAEKAVPAPPPPAAVPPPSPGQDSEFTRFFKDPLPSTGREVNWKAIENQPSSLPAAKTPGEFTRMFGRAERPGAKENPTDLFQNSKADSSPKNSPAQVDDFANMFARPAAASPPKSEAPAQVQASAAPAKPAMPSVSKPAGPPAFVLPIIIAAVLVLAGCALYYFVFRK